MRRVLRLGTRMFFVTAFLLFFCAELTYGLEVGSLIKAPIDSVLTTQFSVGYFEVDLKKKEFVSEKKKREKKDSKKSWDDYLRKIKGTAVRAPDGSIYLIDGHHDTRALYELGEKEIYLEIIESFPETMSQEDFETTMIKRHFVYLFNHDGEPRPFSELPRHIKDLLDDPFRSLAWLLRKHGGYVKVVTPFAEFAWAQFLRSRVVFASFDKAGYLSALLSAFKAIAQDPEEVSKLPGARKQKKVNAACELVLASGKFDL